MFERAKAGLSATGQRLETLNDTGRTLVRILAFLLGAVMGVAALLAAALFQSRVISMAP